MKIIKYFVTWLYLRVVFIPDMKKAIEEEELDPNIKLIPEKVDKNWHEIQRALYEKRFFTLQ